MENEYDLNELKMKIIVKNNHILVENGEKTFIFLIFYNKIEHKRDVLFKEIFGDKMNIEDITLIQAIIKNLQGVVNDYEEV